MKFQKQDFVLFVIFSIVLPIPMTMQIIPFNNQGMVMQSSSNSDQNSDFPNIILINENTNTIFTVFSTSNMLEFWEQTYSSSPFSKNTVSSITSTNYYKSRNSNPITDVYFIKLHNNKYFLAFLQDQNIYYYISENLTDFKSNDPLVYNTLDPISSTYNNILIAEFTENMIILSYGIPIENNIQKLLIKFQIYRISDIDNRKLEKTYESESSVNNENEDVQRFNMKVRGNQIIFVYNILINSINTISSHKIVSYLFNNQANSLNNVTIKKVRIYSDLTLNYPWFIINDSGAICVFTRKNENNNFKIIIYTINLPNDSNEISFTIDSVNPTNSYFSTTLFQENSSMLIFNVVNISFSRIALFYLKLTQQNPNSYSLYIALLDDNFNFLVKDINVNISSLISETYHFQRTCLIQMADKTYAFVYKNKLSDTNVITKLHFRILHLDNISFLNLKYENSFHSVIGKFKEDPNKKNFILVTQVWDQTSQNYDIQASIYSEGGMLIKTFDVNTNKAKNQIEPKIVFFSQDDFLITWKSDCYISFMNFVGQFFDKEANKLGEEVNLTPVNNKVNYGDITDEFNYDLLVAQNDKFILAWHQRNAQNDKDYDSYFIIFDKVNSGMVKTSDLKSINQKEKDQMFPNLLNLGNGYVLISYQNNYRIKDYGFRINFLYININDLNVDNNFSSSIGSTKGNEVLPQMLLLNDDNILVVYLKDVSDSNESLGNNNQNYSLYARKYSRSGVLLKSETPIKSNIAKYKPSNIIQSCKGNNNVCLVKCSSVWDDDYNHRCERSFDEKYDTYFASKKNTATNPESWWSVDFGLPRKIKKIKIWNRVDCCSSRTNEFKIHFGDNIGSFPGYLNSTNQIYLDQTQEQLTQPYIHDIYLNNSGRFLYLSNRNDSIDPNQDDINFDLNFNEIEIYENFGYPIYPKIQKVDKNLIAIAYEPIIQSNNVMNLKVEFFDNDLTNKNIDITLTMENFDRNNKILIFKKDQVYSGDEITFIKANADINSNNYFILSQNFNQRQFETVPIGKFLKPNLTSFYRGELVDCTDNCLSCKDLSRCEVCENEYKIAILLSGQIVCKKVNDSGFSFMTNTDTLIECDISCSTCTNSARSCGNCKTNYYKKEGDINQNYCYNAQEIPDDYFLVRVGSGIFWKRCNASCKTCQVSEKNCKICQQNFHFKAEDTENQTYCYDSETMFQEGYYLSSTDDIFKKCDISCKTCDVSARDCVDCQNIFYKKETDIENPNFCYDKKEMIPKGYFLNQVQSNNNLWKKCHESCLTCNTSDKDCITCNVNYYKKESDLENPSYCYKEQEMAPKGFYLDKIDLYLWKKCNNSCSTCEENPTNCKVCNQGFYPLEKSPNNCISKDKIPPGFYLDSKTSMIKSCGITCKTCIQKATICKDCADEFYKLEEDPNQNNFCFSKKEKLSGFYFDKIIFKKCDEICKECLDSKYKCTECNDEKSYFKLDFKENKYEISKLKILIPKEELDNSDFLCLKDEVDGFFIDKAKKQYSPCLVECSKCSEKGCTECNNSKEYYPFENDLTKCSNETKPGFYLDKEKKIFSKCSEGCIKCVSKAECLECDTKNGFYAIKRSDSSSTTSNNAAKNSIDNSKCYKGCPEKHILDSTLKNCEYFDDSKIDDSGKAKIQSMINNMVSNLNPQNITDAQIANLMSAFKISQDVPVSSEVAHSLVNLSSQMLDDIKSGKQEPNPRYLNVSLVAFSASVRSINTLKYDSNNSVGNKTKKRVLTEAEVKQNQEILDRMKNNVKGFTDTLTDKSSKNNSFMYNSDIFSVEVFSQKAEDKEALEKAALKYNLSLLNFTACENALKENYNIPSNVTLLLKKLEFDASTDLNRAEDPNASKGVKFEFINPLTGKKLDLNICSQVQTAIKIPFKKAERINMDLLVKSQLISNIIDLYDKKSPGYSTRCMKTEQFDTGADTSVNYRRTKLFQNTSMECSPGCEYKGLDQNKYVICDCKISDNDKELSNTGEDGSLLKFPALNYDIALCYVEAYRDVKFFL